MTGDLQWLIFLKEQQIQEKDVSCEDSRSFSPLKCLGASTGKRWLKVWTEKGDRTGRLHLISRKANTLISILRLMPEWLLSREGKEAHYLWLFPNPVAWSSGSLVLHGLALGISRTLAFANEWAHSFILVFVFSANLLCDCSVESEDKATTDIIYDFKDHSSWVTF